MAKIIEPPVLMSRIMTLVLATSAVVLVVLGWTLFKMVPLERPEVFFLLTNTRSVNTVIEPLVPDSYSEQALEYYKQGFVREYIIARNTLYTNTNITRKNWNNIVKNWSSKSVYNALTKTKLYKQYVLDDGGSSMVSCNVNFTGQKPVLRTASNESYDEYVVDFAWICKNSGGQATTNYYKILLRIKSVLDEKMPGMLENLNKLQHNPLGIQVVEYTVRDNKSDPLNSDGYLL